MLKGKQNLNKKEAASDTTDTVFKERWNRRVTGMTH